MCDYACVPVLSHFLCCISLKYGCIMLGLIEIVNFMFLLLARTVASLETSSQLETESQLLEFDWIWYTDKALLLYGVFSAFCLVVGGMTKTRTWILINVIVVPIFVISNIIFINFIHEPEMDEIIRHIVEIVLLLYGWLIAYSYYQELKVIKETTRVVLSVEERRKQFRRRTETMMEMRL